VDTETYGVVCFKRCFLKVFLYSSNRKRRPRVMKVVKGGERGGRLGGGVGGNMEGKGTIDSPTWKFLFHCSGVQRITLIQPELTE
jgi:hypothetical protein